MQAKKRLLRQVVNILLKENPNPTTELKYTNNFTLLLAVTLSAQATDKSVNKATEALFEKISTPQQLLQINREDLLGHFKTLNYYKTKTDNIIKACQILVDKFAGQVPNSMDNLISLPGVGNKTASVIMLQAFGKNAIAVDTHVGRLSQRLGLVNSNNPDKISAQLLEMASKKQVRAIHHLFVLHGRYVCKKIKPLCASCVLSSFCPSNHSKMMFKNYETIYM